VDGRHFDALARRISSRRTAIGGLLVGLLVPLEAMARGKDKRRKHKSKGKEKEKNKKRTSAQAEPCWRANACIVSKGSNVSQCDLTGYTAPDPLDCTRCNLSRSNLRGADLTGVNFTRANLSGACLVNANFFGATFANNTNLYNAIFCNTTMPDGSVNNSGCGSGTPCCPTCGAGQLCTSGCCNDVTCGACSGFQTCGGGGVPGLCGCTPTTCVAEGVTCGSIPDGCGETLQCGICPLGATPSCSAGACASCAATCPASCPICCNLWDGSTFCGGANTFCEPCETNADCDEEKPNCVLSVTDRESGANNELATFCDLPAGTAVCMQAVPCV
jgi:hypothetical protein